MRVELKLLEITSGVILSGGLVARGIIQSTDNHNVNNFIALSSPLNGQFGGE